MEDHIMNNSLLATTALFRGISHTEIESMLTCLHARKQTFQKDRTILRLGDVTDELGMVLSGGVCIENNDLWGNKTILDHVGPGSVFAETYACVLGEPLMVNVVAIEPTTILFLNIRDVLQVCAKSCAYHTKLIRNLLAIAAQKNLNLSRRSFHTAPKSIRGRLLSYLSFQSIQQGSRDFHIPFNRQQLADYLNVDRSALSNELGKMQKEKLLTINKNHFIISSHIS